MKPASSRKVNCLASLTAMGILVVAGNAGAVPVSPRAVGLADNALPLVLGVDALAENPAALALPQRSRWDLQLFSVTTAVGSNALGFNDYLTYNGATLSAADKADILAKVPASGWRLGAHAEASAAALRVGSVGVRCFAYGAARGNLDRELLEILFYGNERDRLYVSELNSGEALAAAEVSFSFGQRLMRRAHSALYGGLTVRLIRGLYYAELAQAEGQLVAGMAGATGAGYATAMTAEGGNGLGITWGAMMTLSPGYTLAVVLENAPGFIRWSAGAEQTQYSIVFDGITADNFEDSLWVGEETATPLSSFTRSLPTRLRMGLGRTRGTFQLAAVAGVGFSNRLAVSTTPEFGIGAEYAPVSCLPLRAGVTVGGLDGFTTGLGTGIICGGFHFEFGMRTAGGVWPTHGRGATLAIAGGLRF